MQVVRPYMDPIFQPGIAETTSQVQQLGVFPMEAS